MNEHEIPRQGTEAVPHEAAVRRPYVRPAVVYRAPLEGMAAACNNPSVTPKKQSGTPSCTVLFS